MGESVVLHDDEGNRTEQGDGVVEVGEFVALCLHACFFYSVSVFFASFSPTIFHLFALGICHKCDADAPAINSPESINVPGYCTAIHLEGTKEHGRGREREKDRDTGKVM